MGQLKKYFLELREKGFKDEEETDILIDHMSDALSSTRLSHTQSINLMKQLFKMMEGAEDYFISWSFIHFMEYLSKADEVEYYRQLIMSLSVKPKMLGLLLANRVLNTLDQEDLNTDKFMRLLRNVGYNNIVDMRLREEAICFYDYQIRQWDKRSPGKPE